MKQYIQNKYMFYAKDYISHDWTEQFAWEGKEKPQVNKHVTI